MRRVAGASVVGAGAHRGADGGHRRPAGVPRLDGGLCARLARATRRRRRPSPRLDRQSALRPHPRPRE